MSNPVCNNKTIQCVHYTKNGSLYLYDYPMLLLQCLSHNLFVLSTLHPIGVLYKLAAQLQLYLFYTYNIDDVIVLIMLWTNTLIIILI